MIKMIACDLDGTLLDSKHQLTDDNIKIVEALKEREIPFVIATGRIYPSAKAFSQALGLTTPIIACNGAVIKDPIKDEILVHYPVKTDLMQAIVKICKRYDIYFHIYTMDTIYAEKNERLIKMYNEWQEKNVNKSLVKTAIVKDINEVIKGNVCYKLGFYIDDFGAQAAYDEIIQLTGLTSCFSLNTLVDIFSEEASKGVAVKAVGLIYGIPTDQILAVGDHENDIAMLEVSGLGIAMLDATDHVKAAANDVTDSNDNSGVAKAIRKHLKI